MIYFFEYPLALFAITLECLSLRNFGDTFLNTSSKIPKWASCAFWILSTFISSNFIFDNNNTTTFFVNFILVIILFAVTYANSIWEKTIIAIISYALLYAVDYLYLVLVFKILNADYNSWLTNPSVYVITMLSSKFTAYMLSYIVKIRFKNKKISTFEKKYFYLSALFPIFSFITLVILLNITFYYNITSYTILIDVFGIILANIFILTIFDKLSLERELEQEKIILEQQLKTETGNVETVKNMFSQQRKLTHDFSNHIHTIHDMAQREQAQTVVDYTENLLSTVSHRTMVIDTNNITVDAIINQKYMKGQQLGIAMSFEINDLSKLPISNNDIVIILGNALDNAIEAAAKTDDKSVKIKILRDESETFISVINSSLPVAIKDKTYVVPKDRNAYHGFGLNNIRTTLSKYKHIFAIDYRKGKFQFCTLIYNETKKA